MADKKKLYTEDSIESLSPLEFTRLRPQVYAGDCTYSTQLLVEILSNAIDEFNLGHGTEINEVGITPSYIVEQEVAYETGMPKLDEDEVYEADTVNIAARAVQTYLKYLGYDVDRVDEYFAIKSSEALKKFQKAHNLRADGKICNEVCVSLFSEVIRKFNEDPFTKDLQLKKAISLCQ